MSDTYWIKPSESKALWFVMSAVRIAGRPSKHGEPSTGERIVQVCTTADGARAWIKGQR